MSLISLHEAPTFARQGVAGSASGHGQHHEKRRDRHERDIAHTAQLGSARSAWLPLAKTLPFPQPQFWDDVNSTSTHAGLSGLPPPKEGTREMATSSMHVM